VVTGGSLRIEKDEVVDDITVLGGSVDVYGEVQGDLAVMGGAATVHDGAYVHGDVSAIGGKVTITSGACVDGEVGVVGGSVDKEPGARVGGSEVSIGSDGPGDNHGDVSASDVKPSDDEPSRSQGRWHWSTPRFIDSASSAVGHTALLFVLGAMLLSLATRRMDILRAEVAARPMRCFAIGILATLALAVSLVALCVTVIGIPMAMIAALGGAFGIYAGICAALATLGKGLVAHRTENRHVHLAVGCVIFLLLSAIPFVGYIVVAVVGLIGVGALAATRLAGFAERKPKATGAAIPGDDPYRTSM